MNKYYIGNLVEDAKVAHNGWVMGTFLNSDDSRKSADMEVKYWEFPVGENDHVEKISETVEFSMFFEGESEGLIDNKKVTLKAGDYVVIQPGVPNNLVKNIVKPVKGLTVKAPSDPGAKIIII